MVFHSLGKGKTFEREIAELLSNSTNTSWSRVPMSGAFATTQNLTDQRFAGDVFTENLEFKDLVIECKSYNSLELNEVFNHSSKFWSWVMQAEREATPKTWVLFIKINHKGIYAVSPLYGNLDRLGIKRNNKLLLDDLVMVKIK